MTRAISRDGDSRDGLRVCHMRTNPVRASHHAMPPHVLQRLPVGESARAGRSTKFAGCVMAAAALAPRQSASHSVPVCSMPLCRFGCSNTSRPAALHAVERLMPIAQRRLTCALTKLRVFRSLTSGRRVETLSARPRKSCGWHRCHFCSVRTLTGPDWSADSSLSPQRAFRCLRSSAQRRRCCRCRGAGSCHRHSVAVPMMETLPGCRFCASMCLHPACTHMRSTCWNCGPATRFST